MAKLITSAERIVRARQLIQEAREIAPPVGLGRFDLSYVAQVKETLRQARNLVKFIPDQPSATPEVKAEVKNIFAEIATAEKELLR